MMKVSSKGKPPLNPLSEEGGRMGAGFADRKKTVVEKTINGQTYEQIFGEAGEIL